MESRLGLRLGGRGLDPAAGLFPSAEATGNVRNGLEPHALRGLCRQRGAQTAGAEEHEALVLREGRFVIRAVGIDPELEHAARARKRARHPPLPLELPRIADVNEDDIVAAVKLDGFVNRQCSISRSAASTNARCPTVMFCGIYALPAHRPKASAAVKTRVV